jgi:hypothetical protein
MLIDVTVRDSEPNFLRLAGEVERQAEVKVEIPAPAGGPIHTYFGRLVGAQETH